MTRLGKTIALIGAALPALGAMSSAQAFPGKCRLTVDGKTYLNGICKIDMSSDGSFSIAGLDRRYFAYVSVNKADGRAIGYWNGVDAESHAHDNLGYLVRKGGCWSNDRAAICAFR